MLFVVIVVVGECVVAYLYLPSASETAAMAKATMDIDSEDGVLLDEDGQPEDQDPANQIEVDLDEFSVTAYQPVSNTALRIDFHLWGIVDIKDETEFLNLKEDNLHRFRQEVLVTMRASDLTDLNEPGLGLVKRKILERTNRILGKPLLRTVIFSDFSLIEQ